MNVFLYIIAFMLLSTAFYLLYRFSFAKTGYFEFNRWYLMGSLLCSAFIPLIDFNVESYVPRAITLETYYIGKLESSYQLFTGGIASFEILWTIYFIGCLIAIGFAGTAIYKIIQIKRNSILKESSFGSYYAHKSIPRSFSFFKWVFIAEEEENIKVVCEHEYIHVRYWHSLDKLLLQLFRIVFWFHPIWRLYEKSIDETHEYIVDNELSKRIDKHTYVSILLGQLMGVSGILLTSGFSDKSILKRRIMMMNQSKKRNWRNYLLLVPTLMAMLVSISCAKGTDTASDLKDQAVQERLQEKSLKANEVDQFPTTENCTETDKNNCFTKAVMSHLMNELKYPAALKEEGISDKIFISFVIDKEGKVSKSKVVRGGNHDLFKEEALRVVNNMPQFIPAMKNGKAVAMEFTVPIVFKV